MKKYHLQSISVLKMSYPNKLLYVAGYLLNAVVFNNQNGSKRLPCFAVKTRQLIETYKFQLVKCFGILMCNYFGCIVLVRERMCTC